ncbi:hypothetical protein RAB80_018021 [Fusarium oxysporum f. sp. vasinfectum]|nr:hypothetical protein RAB80_018021 [Fusarium oxysporum f. sp. vasinfectum]
MSSPLVNGDMSAAQYSAFIQLSATASISSSPTNTASAPSSSAKPLTRPSLLPYFSKPYQYASPYVQKVDSLGSKTLDRIDERFPVAKKPIEELYQDTRALILFPYHKSLEGKDHVFQVYNSEVKKNEQTGLVVYGKAAATTVLVVSNETLSWISSPLHQKKAETTNMAK